MTFRRRNAFVAATVLALAAGAFLLVRFSAPAPTDAERVRALLSDAALAAQEKRVGGVLAGVSERFRGDSLDRAGLKQLVAFQVLRGEWNRVAITAERIAVEGDAATATVHVLLARSGSGDAVSSVLPAAGSAYRIACTLAREEAGWRVVAATWRSIPLDEALSEPAASVR